MTQGHQWYKPMQISMHGDDQSPVSGNVAQSVGTNSINGLNQEQFLA